MHLITRQLVYASFYFILTLQTSIVVAQSPKELYRLALAAEEKGDFFQSEKLLLSILEKKDGIKEKNLVAVYNQLGIINKQLGRYEKAIKHYKCGEIIASKNLSELRYKLPSLYHNQATIFKNNGDYKKALEYFQESLTNLDAEGLNEKEKRMAKATTYNNIGLVYYEQNDYSTAIIYLKKRMSIGEKFNLEGHDNAYHNYANCLANSGDYEEAENYYKKCISIRLKEFGNEYYRLASVYMSFGKLKLKIGNKEEALGLYKKAHKIYKVNYGEKHPRIAEILEVIGDYYLAQNNHKEAINYYQKSLMANSVKFNDSTFTSNPELKDILSDIQFLRSLKKKSRALMMYYFHLSNNKDQVKYLKACIETSELSYKLIHKMRNSYSHEASQLLLSKDTKSIFETATQATLELGIIESANKNLERIFEYLEKSKSATLGAFLNNLNVKSFLSIPDSLLEKEKELAANRRYLETEIQKAKAKRAGYDTLLVQNF